MTAAYCALPIGPLTKLLVGWAALIGISLALPLLAYVVGKNTTTTNIRPLNQRPFTTASQQKASSSHPWDDD